MPADTPLLQALQDPDLFDHPVSGFEVLETHISWVLLTGSYAYKIKKPVDLGFLDFSTLAKRRHYCHEELRLNRRTAPQIYLDVVGFTGRPEAPVVGGSGAPFEYAVKMVQFPQDRLLDRLAGRGELTPGHVDRLAATVADFHERVAIASVTRPYGTPEAVRRPVRENFLGMRDHLTDPALNRRLDALEAWSEQQHEALRPLFEARRRQGFVRECHGDLHLGNIADLSGRITPFDCIEFNDRLRWIDVMSEVAFTSMDLEDRDRPELAARFLDAYLSRTGDYDGLRLAVYYKSYRALVRAKIAAIRLDQPDLDAEQRRRTQDLLEGYLALAERYTRPPQPALLLNHGPSGAGKTTLSQPLLETVGAVRIRSDVERKRLFGLGPGETSGSAADAGIYTREASDRTYHRLATLAEAVLRAGFPVIVDATFLERQRRRPFAELAERLGVPFAILDYRADPETLRRRVQARQAAGRDVSEADTGILERQLEKMEPFSDAETEWVIELDTTVPGAAERLREAVPEAVAAQSR